MFKKVTIKMTDTCLTFVLKRLGILDKFINLDGFEFVEKFKMTEIFDSSSLQKGDIIVLVRKCYKFKKQNTIIDENGVCYMNHFNLSYHFMLFEGNFISEYGYFGITTFDINFINIKKSNFIFYKINHLDVISYA